LKAVLVSYASARIQLPAGSSRFCRHKFVYRHTYSKFCRQNLKSRRSDEDGNRYERPIYVADGRS